MEKHHEQTKKSQIEFRKDYTFQHQKRLRRFREFIEKKIIKLVSFLFFLIKKNNNYKYIFPHIRGTIRYGFW